MSFARSAQLEPAGHVGLLDTHSAELAQLIIATLPLYGDADSQRAVMVALRPALHHEGFVRAFAAGLVRLDPARCTRGECQVVVAWTCALVPALELPGAKKAVVKIAERQVRVSAP